MTEQTPSRHVGRKVAAGAALVALPVVGGYVYLETRDSGAQARERQARGYQYDMAALQQVDPALIKWRQVARLETGLLSARAVAVDSAGTIFVGGDGAVRALNAAGSPTADVAVTGDVQALAAGPGGLLYVGLMDHVEVFGPEGRRAVWPSLGGKSQITSIAVGADAVYAGDFGNRIVHRLGLDGKVLGTVGQQINLPSPHMDVAVAADGTIWLANTGNHRLENYSPRGDLNRFWGEPGTAIERFIGCCNPADFWLLADGSFVTAEKGVLRVKHYGPEGQFKGVVAAPASFPGNMLGADVTADAQGRIIVLARGAGVVQVFEALP